ncbi:hypothetical protein ACWDA9_40335, partial [Streptomyces sp. NPDC001193]
MRATLRWAHADFRAHRGEALFVVLASAGIIASLLLAGALFSYAANPWQRIFRTSEAVDEALTPVTAYRDTSLLPATGTA